MMRSLPSFRSVVLYVAAWSPLVLMYMPAIAANTPMTTLETLRASIGTVSVAAALGVLVVWHAKVSPWPSTMTLGFVLRHLAAAAAYGFAWIARIVYSLLQEFGSVDRVQVEIAGWWGWQTFIGALVYFVVAGITWTVDSARRTREREQALLEAEALRVKAELGALRGQLDPHFLFNTLHTVSVLTRHDPALAATAIEKLAELLRYVLDAQRGAREDVPLGDELAFIDAYLALEGLRLGQRLKVERSIAPEALERRIPSLALQPLVENALKYGISPRPEGGTLRLVGRVEAQALVLEVSDDGPGAANLEQPQGTGVGLDTLRKRLIARYGPRAGMQVRTAPGAGFSVTVTVPA